MNCETCCLPGYRRISALLPYTARGYAERRKAATALCKNAQCAAALLHAPCPSSRIGPTCVTFLRRRALAVTPQQRAGLELNIRPLRADCSGSRATTVLRCLNEHVMDGSRPKPAAS